MIKLSKSCLSSLEKEAVMRVLDNEYLGMGKEVCQFEIEIADYFSKNVSAVCVNSGTAALHLACQTIGLRQGDEVLVPTLTYVATFQAISASGAKPIACDVLYHNGLIDLHDAKKRLTSKTKAIMPVHYAGNMGDLDGIYTFAKENNLRVIEDAAHGFGSKYKGDLIGSIGDIVCFSFDGIKNITSGEGGVVLSSDEKVIQKVKDTRLLAVSNDTEKRNKGERSWDFDVSYQGWRYHMSDINAALGRVQLEKFRKDLYLKRDSLVRRYKELLCRLPEVILFDENAESDIIPYNIPIMVTHDRDALRNYLLLNGIETGIHYKPNHLLSYYKTQYSLPVAEEIYRSILSLPLHHDLSVSEVEYIVKIIANYYCLHGSNLKQTTKRIVL